ncbi:MAG: GNAT family N-acetyltransferase [Ilumatobacteraceae bacterium]
MSVKPATCADVDAVVSIHRGALPRDVAPALGAPFLERFYRRVLSSPDQVLLVVRNGDDVEGFCALAMQPPPLRAALRPTDLWTFARKVVRSPSLLASSIVQARRRTVSDWDGCAEIAFVAVDQRHAGRGHGTDLVRAATAIAAERGKHSVVTKTANPRLAEFYQREFEAAIIAEFAAVGSTYMVLEWRAAPAQGTDR